MEQDLTEEDLPPHIAVKPDGCSIVIEKQVVVRDLRFPDAMQLMFCLFFTLNLEYPRQKRKSPIYYFEFVQKVLMQLNGHKLSPKITTFLNAVMAHEVPEAVDGDVRGVDDNADDMSSS